MHSCGHNFNPGIPPVACKLHNRFAAVLLRGQGVPLIITESHTAADLHVCYKHNNEKCSQPEDGKKCFDLSLSWVFYYEN